MEKTASSCPEKFTLYWLEQQLLDAPNFASEALEKLRELDQQLPKKFRSTHTMASSASELVNHWLVERDLMAYQRGKPIDDYAALSIEPINVDFGDAMDLLQMSIDIKRDELIALLEKNDMTVPEFLRSSANQQPNTEDGESSSQTTTLPKQLRQEDAILRWLKTRGHEPKNLPPRPQGARGVKADARDELLRNHNLFTERSFAKAWERLRNRGELIGGE